MATKPDSAGTCHPQLVIMWQTAGSRPLLIRVVTSETQKPNEPNHKFIWQLVTKELDLTHIGWQKHVRQNQVESVDWHGLPDPGPRGEP